MADFGRFKLSYNDAKEIVAAYDNLNDTEFADHGRNARRRKKIIALAAIMAKRGE